MRLSLLENDIFNFCKIIHLFDSIDSNCMFASIVETISQVKGDTFIEWFDIVITSSDWVNKTTKTEAQTNQSNFFKAFLMQYSQMYFSWFFCQNKQTNTKYRVPSYTLILLSNWISFTQKIKPIILPLTQNCYIKPMKIRWRKLLRRSLFFSKWYYLFALRKLKGKSSFVLICFYHLNKLWQQKK